ncbi:MAG: alpha/beta hydrolase [Minwuia sp.]|uniref:alpha/beta hydrolase n=1 Tax=Minwuia sp. TaxID=2493630 RepID=UPI003A871142
MISTSRGALFGGALACLLAGGALAADPVTVEQTIGGRTALADWVEGDGAEAGTPVVLLLHGTLAHRDQELIDTLQELLAERGVSSLAPGLTFGQDRREGMYDCAVPFRHTHEEAVDELAVWAAWLKAEGHGRIVVAGHSRGGNQAALFARAHPDLTEKLVAIAPAVGHDDAERDRRYQGRYGANRSEVIAMADTAGELTDVPGIVYCRDAKATPAAIRSYLGGAFQDRDTPTVISGLTMPVLVIAGSKDTVVPEVPDRMTGIADGKRVRLEVIQDAGHMFLDFFAEDAADLIAEFVAD